MLVFSRLFLRGCSYGDELARLGGLACLGEISPSLRNSSKYIMSIHMRNEPARLGEISLDFAVIPPRRDKNFPYEHTQVGQPARRDRVLFSQLCFVFEMLI